MRAGLRVGMKEKLVRSLCRAPLIKRQHIDLASLLCNPTRSMRKEFVTDFYGFRYVGSINNLTDWCVYFFENFIESEMALFRNVRSLCKRQGKPFICYDIGANSGYMSLAMASCADKVIAVEPFPRAHSELIQRVKSNNIRHIKAFQVGLGEGEETITFDVISMINLIAKRTRFATNLAPLGTFNAKVIRGDDLMRNNRLDPPSLIRINAGSDCLSILHGLSDTLLEHSPAILIDLPVNSALDTIPEEALRAVLYEDASLSSFQRTHDDKSYHLDTLRAHSRRIACFPKDMMRMAEQELCKLQGARLYRP